MNNQSNPPKLPRSLKSRALLGTALALVVGGALVGEGVILPTIRRSRIRSRCRVRLRY